MKFLLNILLSYSLYRKKKKRKILKKFSHLSEMTRVRISISLNEIVVVLQIAPSRESFLDTFSLKRKNCCRDRDRFYIFGRRIFVRFRLRGFPRLLNCSQFAFPGAARVSRDVRRIFRGRGAARCSFRRR